MADIVDNAARKAALRAAILNSKTPSVAVKIGELDIEVRAPTMSEQVAINKFVGNGEPGNADIMKMVVHQIISTCYVPGTDEKVFSALDADVLMSSNSMGPTSRLAIICASVFQGQPVKDEDLQIPLG